MKHKITSITALMAFAFVGSVNGAEYTQQSYPNYMETSDSTFTSTSSMYFNSGWTSYNDTITTNSGLYLQGANLSALPTKTLYNITGANITAKKSLYSQKNANVLIENSTLNINERIYVQQGESSLYIKNSTTTLNATGLSQVVDGSSLTIDGGSFTITGSQQISVKQGSTIAFKNITVDLGENYISTGTETLYKNASAKIVIDNAKFTAHHIELYGYTTAGELPILEIKNGSTITTVIGAFMGPIHWNGMRGGTIIVSDNSVFNSTSDLYQADESDNQVYTSDVIVKNGSKISVDGDVALNSVSLTSNSVLEADNVSVKSLVVAEDSTISLADAGTLSFENLEIIVDDMLTEGSEIDLNSVLSGGLGVVLSSLEADDAILISNGVSKFNAVVDANGVALVGAAVPEPSQWAMIFGIVALGFVMYFRRK